MKPAAIKTIGYLTSTISVMLLGVVSWKTARTNPLILAALIGGMLLSVAGMALRLYSFGLAERST